MDLWVPSSTLSCLESGFAMVTSQISTRCWQVPISLYTHQLKPTARSTFCNTWGIYTYMYLRGFITLIWYLQLFLDPQDTISRNRFNFLQERFLYNHSKTGRKHIQSWHTIWQVHWNTFPFALFCSLLLWLLKKSLTHLWVPWGWGLGQVSWKLTTLSPGPSTVLCA